MTISLKGCRKWPVDILCCASAKIWCQRVERHLFNMWLGISSGLDALFSASLLIARSIYKIVILKFIGIESRYLALEISLRSVGGRSGKNALLNISIFCLLVTAVPSSIGIQVLVRRELKQSLTFQMLCSSASLMNFCHVFRLYSSIVRQQVQWRSFHAFSLACLQPLLNF